MNTYRVEYIDDGADQVPAGGVIGRGLYIQAAGPIDAALKAAQMACPGEAVESITERPGLTWADFAPVPQTIPLGFA